MSKTEPVPEPKSNSAQAPFEQALQTLENIVDAMESEDLPLEELLAKFEEGSRMVKVCQSKLAEAELKIQSLEKDEKGRLTLKPLAVNEEKI